MIMDIFINDENLYSPRQKDKLFWCFYILLYGKEEYDYTLHFFDIEKKFKISAVEKLRNMKAILRVSKLKYTDIECELVNVPKISIKGLHALCIVHNIIITYITENTYYVLGNTHEEPIYKNCVIISYSNVKPCTHSGNAANNTIGIHLNASTIFVNNMKHTRIFINNYNKPILTISAYTLQKLQDMAEILHITIKDHKGKKKFKKQLYQDISEKIL